MVREQIWLALRSLVLLDGIVWCVVVLRSVFYSSTLTRL